MSENLPRHFGRSESIGALAAALAKAQGEIKGAAKDSANPFFNSKYADLASIRDACAGPLSANGLAVIQFPRMTDHGVEVETLLAHSSGEWVSEVLAVPVAKKDAQGVGSAITYGRRYALAALTGVAPEDDDGNAAVGNAKEQKQKPAKEEPKKDAPDVPSKALVAKTLKQIDALDSWAKVLSAREFVEKRGFTAEQKTQLAEALFTRAELIAKQLIAAAPDDVQLDDCRDSVKSFGFPAEALGRLEDVLRLREESLREAA